MNEKRQQILKWHQNGLVDELHLDQALEITEANNTPKQWLSFISSSLLWLSILSIAFGTIFFFAYNWNEISTMQKFSLIQGLMLVSVFFYTQTQAQSPTNIALLFFLSLLIGSLFALFGQTYQTGKDPWQLFLLWTVFTTPLAFTSKSSSLWLLWLGLANLTLTLFLEVRHGLFGYFSNERYLLLFAFLNMGAALFLEYFFHSKFKLIASRIAAQVAIIAAMVAFTWVAIYSIFESGRKEADIIFYIAWMAGVYYFYRVRTIDVLVLSSWVVSGIVAIVAFFGRTIGNDFDGGIFLFLGLIIIGLSTAGVKWLLKLLKETNVKGEIV